jgi:hypothetical protein
MTLNAECHLCQTVMLSVVLMTVVSYCRSAQCHGASDRDNYYFSVEFDRVLRTTLI